MNIRSAFALLVAVAALSACNEEDSPPIDEAAAERGEALVQDCKACHQLTRRGNLVGPHLVKIYGRQVASVSGFEYSEALAAEDFTWDSARLAAFVLNPTEAYPGTMMAYDGLTEAEAADIAEYFRAAAQ